jgi:hypothetical protein
MFPLSGCSFQSSSSRGGGKKSAVSLRGAIAIASAVSCGLLSVSYSTVKL